MANWRGHVGGGVVAAAVFAGTIWVAPIDGLAEAAGFVHDWQVIAALFVVSVLFALFPDVDTNSKGQDIFYWVVLPLDVVLILSGNVTAAAYLGLIAMLPVVGHHRGWTHSRWAALVVPLPILFVPFLQNHTIAVGAVVFYGAAVVGYVSHLLLDGMLFGRGKH